MKLVRRPREERSACDRDAIETNEKRVCKKQEGDRERWEMRGENRDKVGGAMGRVGYLPIIHARDRSWGGEGKGG